MQDTSFTDLRTPSAHRSERGHGYFTSSMDLRHGLEVSALALSQLPAELQHELHRLQRSWGPSFDAA